MMFIIAQVSAHDDFIFRVLLIPGGLWLSAIGIRAIRRRKLHLRRRGGSVKGLTAVILGGIVVVIGLLCVAAAIRSFIEQF